MSHVGYKKPPKHTQFKKGTSGNPKGRPKKQKAKLADPGHALAEILSEMAIVSINGKKKTITMQEYILRTMVNKAAKGASKEIAMIQKAIASLPHNYKDPKAIWFRQTEGSEERLRELKEIGERYLKEYEITEND